MKGLGDDVLMDCGAFGLDYVDLIIKKGNHDRRTFESGSFHPNTEFCKVI